MNTAKVMVTCTFLGSLLSVFGGFVALCDFQELLEFSNFFRLYKRDVLPFGGLNIFGINIIIFLNYILQDPYTQDLPPIISSTKKYLMKFDKSWFHF